METQNKKNVHYYPVWKLMKLDPSHPIFEHIRKQRVGALQIHSLTGYQILSNYSRALQAENLIYNVIHHSHDPLFGNVITYDGVEFLDEKRDSYAISDDDSPIRLRNVKPDLLAHQMFFDQTIEVKCMYIDKEETFNLYKNNIWNPFHTYFKHTDPNDLETNWKKFSHFYIHDADIVVVVPVIDGKLADKEYGVCYYRTKDAKYSMKNFPQGNGFRFYIQMEPMNSLEFFSSDVFKYNIK